MLMVCTKCILRLVDFQASFRFDGVQTTEGRLTSVS